MTEPFSIPLFLESVRDARPLAKEHLQFFIKNLAQFPDEQISAFLAHAYHRPLARESIVNLTLAMRDSGRVLGWKGLHKPVVDKHSTGGVGDKISLCLAPLLAAMGMAVPMISGRGLGFTGGTLDKLESISGFSTALSIDAIEKQVRTLGLAFGQQTKEIAPADAKLYALRDVTATVESIPLITASILSKKLAESLNALILDVKWGSGAFMPSLEGARALAASLVDIARQAGTKTAALLTNMNQPLGHVSGNWCEVVESVLILKNDPWVHTHAADTLELTLDLAAHLAALCGLEASVQSARMKAEKTLASGKPFEIFCAVVQAQGGRPALFEGSLSVVSPTKQTLTIKADSTGFISSIQTKRLGQALVLAKAGRQRQTDRVDPLVTLVHPVKVGSKIQKGDPLCHLHLNDHEFLPQLENMMQNAYVIKSQAPSAFPLITEALA